MKIKTSIILTILLITSCTITAKQTGDKDWAISLKPDGTGVNIQPTQPQATTSPLASPANPISSVSPTPNPNLTPQTLVIKKSPSPTPAPTPITTQPVVQPCSKFTYQLPQIKVPLNVGTTSKKIAIPSCQIQTFLIAGISGAKLTIDGDDAGVAIVKGNTLLTQSSPATKGIATLNFLKAETYKVEIVSREDKFYTVIFNLQRN